MHTIHTLLVYIHIVVGALALPLFWMPVVAQKGSPLHVNSGRFYSYAMYIVSVTAFVASAMVLADPLGVRRPGQVFEPARASELAAAFRTTSLFLLMLSVLVFTSIRHGLVALRMRRGTGTLAAPLHRAMIVALGSLAVGVGAIGLVKGHLLLIIFGAIGSVAAVTMFRDTLLKKPRPGQLVLAHLDGLISSGIGAYTAFFAFGGARLLGELLPGQWQVVPWVLPAIIGTIAINRLKRRYGSGLRQARRAAWHAE